MTDNHSFWSTIYVWHGPDFHPLRNFKGHYRYSNFKLISRNRRLFSANTFTQDIIDFFPKLSMQNFQRFWNYLSLNFQPSEAMPIMHLKYISYNLDHIQFFNDSDLFTIHTMKMQHHYDVEYLYYVHFYATPK